MDCDLCKKEIVPPAVVDVFRPPYGKLQKNLCEKCHSEVTRVKHELYGTTNEVLLKAPVKG